MNNKPACDLGGLILLSILWVMMISVPVGFALQAFTSYKPAPTLYQTSKL
jgi:hypothetical protein